jgi:hypothetical protein
VIRLLRSFGPALGALALPLEACDAADTSPKVTTMPALPSVQEKIVFTRADEKDRLSTLDAQADQLYRHARWLIRQQPQQEVPLRYPRMEGLLYIPTVLIKQGGGDAPILTTVSSRNGA